MPFHPYKPALTRFQLLTYLSRTPPPHPDLYPPRIYQLDIMMTSTVATSRQAERRSLRSPPPKPKSRLARPPVPAIPLHFLKPQPQPQPQSATVVKPVPAPAVMFLPAGSCLVQPHPKTQPQPPRPRAAAPSTEVAHRHAHLYDYKPLAGAQYQTLKCKLIFLHEARKRDSIVYHSVRDV